MECVEKVPLLFSVFLLVEFFFFLFFSLVVEKVCSSPFFFFFEKSVSHLIKQSIM